MVQYLVSIGNNYIFVTTPSFEGRDSMLQHMSMNFIFMKIYVWFQLLIGKMERSIFFLLP